MIRPAFHGRRPVAFTLVELMLSIALVVILLVGVNYIFKTAADAIGGGQILNEFNRNSQAVQSQLSNDFSSVAKDGPCFIIASREVVQFLNQADADGGFRVQAGPTQGQLDPTIISPATASAPVVSVVRGVPSYRAHRADMVKFFARGLFHRHSADDGSFTSSTTSTDAYIQLGHGSLPKVDLSSFTGPTSNTTEIKQRLGAYASDWVLARSVTLLKDPASLPLKTPGTAWGATNNFVNNHCYYRIPNAVMTSLPAYPGAPPYPSGFPYAVNLTPLAYGSMDEDNAGSGKTLSDSSRYDLAAVTMDQFRGYIADAINSYKTGAPLSTTKYSGLSLWWFPLVYSFESPSLVSPPPPNQNMAMNQTKNASPPFLVTPAVIPPPTSPALPAPTINTPQPQVVPLPLNEIGTFANGGAPPYSGPKPLLPLLARVEINPIFSTPLNAASVGQMAPYFMEHCSQFIVEYAGDYLQQDNNAMFVSGTSNDPNAGAIIGIGKDGQIDYYLDPLGNRHIRWYGMPRSSSGGIPNPTTKVVIRGFDPSVPDDPTLGKTMQEFKDVIPLRDYYTMFYYKFPGSLAPDPAITIAPFTAGEQVAPPWEADVNFDPSHDYANPGAFTGYPAKFSTGVTFGQGGVSPRYVAAWYNDMPAMIRILIKVDDPNNKVKDGPWYEFVYRLK
ncbi:MAG: type II secretion system GspH family protein [Planctomycetota bacterium]|nr:type II secretion system GspH family protein [Planctomycetota bacterium]